MKAVICLPGVRMEWDNIPKQCADAIIRCVFDQIIYAEEMERALCGQEPIEMEKLPTTGVSTAAHADHAPAIEALT